MPEVKAKPRLTSLAPQFLVDDLERSMRVLPEARLHVRRAVGGVLRDRRVWTDWNFT